MNTYHRKKYLNRIKQALESEKLVILYGQRQVGKTTLLKQLIEDEDLKGEKKYFSFEDITKREFSGKQEFIDFLSFKLDIDFLKDGFLFLDEVQYIKNIVGLLKSLYDDEIIKLKIVATGSGMWNIPTTAGSSLVGRGEEIIIYPFSFDEFLEIKGVNTKFLELSRYSDIVGEEILNYYKQYLIWGGYPEVIKAQTEEMKNKELQKIVKRFFEKDVAFWFDKEDFVEFEKIYYYIYQNIGNLLKIERISDITGIGVKKVKKYLIFLKRSLVVSEVRPFFKDKTKEIFSLPNMYISDLGILSFLSKNYGDKINDGKVVENFVFLELQKTFYNDEIKFYKKKNGTEIDFILEDWKGKIIPIEVKSSDSLAVPKIFYSFLKDYEKQIKYFVKTTKLKLDTTNIDSKKLYFVPNFLISKISFCK